MRHAIILGLHLLFLVPAFGQQSTSYKAEERVLNAGGSPDGGMELTSAGYRVTLSSLGDGLLSMTLSSSSFQVHGGFVGGHKPPGEVMNLVFINETTLQWDPDSSAGTYNMYRDLLSNLGGMGYGNCQQTGLISPTTLDTDTVPPGDAFFYLVTVENTILQEGPKGFQGGGAARLGPTCP